MAFDETTRLAETMLSLQQSRVRELPSELFGEPGWEIILLLFLADAHGQRLSTAALSERASGSANTCRRWIKYLLDEELIAGDVADDSERALTLTPKALHAVEQWLGDIRRVFEARWGANFHPQPA